MNEISALWQSAPWLVVGGALVLINIVLLLKLTRKLIFLAAGALLIAVGIYTGVIDAPVGLLALPFFAI